MWGFFSLSLSDKQVNLKLKVRGGNLQIQIKWQIYDHAAPTSFAATPRGRGTDKSN